MIPLSRRSLLAVAAVVDVALHARPGPVNARALASRHELSPRNLEAILQALVRAGILKGVRGPRGGYEVARDRRRISVGDVVRAVSVEASHDAGTGGPRSGLIDEVVAPALAEAAEACLRALDAVSVADLCARAGVASGEPSDFTI